MRLLFTLDSGDYDSKGNAFVRHSARCITIKDKKIAMVHSRQYDYYKFPGGGIEAGEDPQEAMIRETHEEAGLIVTPESIRPYGFVHRVEKSDQPGCDLFIQDNFYYLCDVLPEPVPQILDDYEASEGFVLEYVDPNTAIDVNRNRDHGPKEQTMLEREARVLELLQKEGIL